MLILVAGDAHIPERATSIPSPIRKLLQPGKIDKVVLLGNISDQSSCNYFETLAPETPITSVLGDGDIPTPKSQTSVVFQSGKFRIGVVSSFLIVPVDDVDVLASIARKLDVDILLYGGKREQETQNWANYYFINPGSVTGAATDLDFAETPNEPGFCILDIKDDSCTLFMYQLRGDKFNVEKAELPHISRTH